jgi:hypothetical protein
VKTLLLQKCYPCLRNKVLPMSPECTGEAFAYIKNLADIGVIQCRNGFGFLLKRPLCCSRTFLMATMRPRRVSRAFHTSPIPPMDSMISYGPSFSPITEVHHPGKSAFKWKTWIYYTRLSHCRKGNHRLRVTMVSDGIVKWKSTLLPLSN